MILVAGESLVDLLVDEEGAIQARLGGGPLNVARGLARLGAPCALLTAVSTDPFGRLVRRALIEDGVDPCCLVESELPTTLALAQLDDGAARYRFYADGTAAPSLTDADVAAVVPRGIEALHVGTLGLALEPIGTALEHLVQRLGRDTLVMLDPNCRPNAIPDHAAYRARLARVLIRADVVKVSGEDLAYLDPGTPAERAARGLLAGRTRCVLVTDGDREVRVITAGAELEIPTVPVRVVDTVGAGDAFCAGFLAWWTGGGLNQALLSDPRLVEQGAAFAALVAGVTCERSGADPPTLEELEHADALRG